MFYSNDHEPIHIHVIKEKGRHKTYAKFQVVPHVELLENYGLKAKELRLAKQVIIENVSVIVGQWNFFFNK
ncbi:DUF4160 domain-containing protein [Niabella insulamsoli]|uniref:DUF4160 domain-containing protein n=1 Tax=Niabella insulamsoli TaxID=3144874 RepID=UPI0031FBD2C9